MITTYPVFTRCCLRHDVESPSFTDLLWSSDLSPRDLAQLNVREILLNVNLFALISVRDNRIYSIKYHTGLMVHDLSLCAIWKLLVQG